MAIRSLVVSGLALAAALAFAQPGRAQGFFSFYEMSPRQIVGMLQDDGYELRGAMVRNGDVYICNVVSVSGRSERLIVAARDGHILERYAVRSPRWRDPSYADAPQNLHPPRDIGGGDHAAASDDEPSTHRQEALGDLFNPPTRIYGGDVLAPPKPVPEDTPVAKPKHHAVRKHKEPSVAKTAPDATPTPDAATGEKPAAGASPSSVAVDSATASPEPKKPAVDAVKPEPTPTVAASPEPAQRKAEAEKAPAPEPKAAASAKPEQPRKKINDLPVGTLD